MKGRMFLTSEFNKGTSTTFFVPLVKVHPHPNHIINRLLMIPRSNIIDRSECEYVSLEVNQIGNQLKKHVKKYNSLIGQSASRKRFR